MRLTWDETKNDANRQKHGVAFEDAVDFVWETAVINLDLRREYGERRWSAMGLLDGRLHNLVFTWREDSVRIISLRKANDRELKNYEASKEDDS